MAAQARIGVVGCGAITRNLHLPNIMTNPRLQLVGLMDADLSAAKWLRELFQVAVPIHDALEAIDGWDAALVAVPPHLHGPVSKTLLEKGIHVLCEKPLATSMSDVEALLATAQAVDRHLMVIMQKYYQPNTGLLKDLLTDDLLGEIESIDLQAVQRSQWDAANPNRFDPSRTPGGVTFENGIHWLYRMNYWFGEARLQRYADDRMSGVEANGEIDCLYALAGRDVPCSMYFSADHSGKNRLLVQGTRMNAILEDGDKVGVRLQYDCAGTPLRLAASHEQQLAQPNSGFAQLDAFCSLILNEPGSSNPSHHSHAALGFLLDCYSRREDLPQPWVG